MKKIIVGLILGIFCELNLFAGDFELGVESFRKSDFLNAIELFSKACDEENVKACHNLGVIYTNGYGTKQDYNKAYELFNKACDGGYANGCYNLGVSYYKGYVKQDSNKACELYEKACNGGNVDGCYNLGIFYQNEQGVKQDINKVIDLYEKACDGENAMGCYNLGVFYSNGEGVKQDYSKANELYEKACNGGFEDACYNLGILYLNGEKIKPDKFKAYELFEKACNGGNVNGCFKLGANYIKGKGIIQDNDRAIELYEKACDSKIGKECYTYDLGNEFSQIGDHEKAIKLWKKACEFGDLKSCFVLGVMEEDLSKASELFKKACDGGYKDGCFKLENLYANRDRVKHDYSKAYELFVNELDKVVFEEFNSYEKDYNFFDNAKNNEAKHNLLKQYELSENELLLLYETTRDDFVCHSCAPNISWFYFKCENSRWVLKNKIINSEGSMGSWGKSVVPELIKVDKNLFIFKYIFGYMGQGVLQENLYLHSFSNGEFNEIFEYLITYDDTGTGYKLESNWKSKFSFIKKTNQYPDLIIERSGLENSNKFKEKKVYKFIDGKYISN